MLYVLILNKTPKTLRQTQSDVTINRCTLLMNLQAEAGCKVLEGSRLWKAIIG